MPQCHSPDATLQKFLFSPDATLRKFLFTNPTMPLFGYWKLWLLVGTKIEFVALCCMQCKHCHRKKQQSKCAAVGNPKFPDWKLWLPVGSNLNLWHCAAHDASIVPGENNNQTVQQELSAVVAAWSGGFEQFLENDTAIIQTWLERGCCCKVMLSGKCNGARCNGCLDNCKTATSGCCSWWIIGLTKEEKQQSNKNWLASHGKLQLPEVVCVIV